MTLKILDCSNFIYTGDVSHKTISRGIREVAAISIGYYVVWTMIL